MLNPLPQHRTENPIHGTFQMVGMVGVGGWKDRSVSLSTEALEAKTKKGEKRDDRSLMSLSKPSIYGGKMTGGGLIFRAVSSHVSPS